MSDHIDILPSSDAAELIDFTCATSWERLALDIELELRAWGVQDGAQSPKEIVRSIDTGESKHNRCNSAFGPQPLARSTVSIGNRTLVMELRCNRKAKPWDAYPLERLLGVSKCVLLTADTPDAIIADDGSDAAVLLSAMAVAASACSCSLPMIVPVGRPSSLRFIGRQLYPRHLRFSCDYTYQLSEDYTHLAGLLKLFQNKRVAAKRLSAPSLDDAHIAAKFIYEWADFSFKLAPTPGSFAFERKLNAVQAIALAQADPVRKVRVTAVWDEFPASALQQNTLLAGMPASTASRLRLSPSADLVEAISGSQIPLSRIPLTAPASLILRLSQEASNLRGNADPAAPLAIVDVRKCIRAIRALKGNEKSPAGSQARIDGHHSSAQVAYSPGPSALGEFLIQVGEYVAAAAVRDDSIDEQFLTSAVAALFEMDLGRGIMADVVDALGPNAAETTVLERLARLVAASETVDGARKLWNLFLDGVEVHWEQQWIVSGLPFNVDDGPDHDASLVMQKLQMVNCCVERRRREAAGFSDSANLKNNDGRKSLLEGVELIGEEQGIKSDPQKGTNVWEPFVQPHPLVTRDMVEEELERMVMRAESSGRNEDVEAKRQSLTLKSDMMAFKAANPTASMADFVRWFSPSDWVPGEEEAESGKARESSSALKGKFEQVGEKGILPMKLEGQMQIKNTATPTKAAHENLNRRGRLSARMARKGNIWEKLWKEAEGLPARKQVPLFDAAAHGSKALGDLRAMSMTQVLLHLAAIQGNSGLALLHNAFSRGPALPNVRNQIDATRQTIREICSTLNFAQSGDAEMGRVAAAVDSVARVEHTSLIATSIFTKLPPVDGLSHVVDSLACGRYADVIEKRERELVARMAGLGDGGWRSVLLPECREFVIRGGEVSESEEEMTDRMYARLSREEFRVAFRLGLDYSV